MALRGGVEAASFWGIVLLVGGLFLLLEENLHLREPEGPNLVLAGAAFLLALAAWRLGNPVFAGFAAGALFVLLARAPQGRLLWIAAGVALSAVAGRFTDRPSWAPSHRACAWGLVVCGIAAVYAGVNVWSLDHRTIEQLGSRARALPEAWPGDGARAAAILATALVPLAVLPARRRAAPEAPPRRGARPRRALARDAARIRPCPRRARRPRCGGSAPHRGGARAEPVALPGPRRRAAGLHRGSSLRGRNGLSCRRARARSRGPCAGREAPRRAGLYGGRRQFRRGGRRYFLVNDLRP